MSNPLKKMVNKAQNGAPTNAKQREDIFARVGALETRFNLLVRQTKASFQALSEQVNAIGQVVDAISQIIGLEQVQDRVLKNRIDALENQAEAETKALQESLEKGEMVEGDTIKPTSFVVTQQHNAEGQLMHPSRVSIPFDGYTDQVKPLLERRKAGDVIDLEGGMKLTVLSVYEIVAPEPGNPEPPAITPSSASA